MANIDRLLRWSVCSSITISVALLLGCRAPGPHRGPEWQKALQELQRTANENKMDRKTASLYFSMGNLDENFGNKFLVYKGRWFWAKIVFPEIQKADWPKAKLFIPKGIPVIFFHYAQASPYGWLRNCWVVPLELNLDNQERLYGVALLQRDRYSEKKGWYWDWDTNESFRNWEKRADPGLFPALTRFLMKNSAWKEFLLKHKSKGETLVPTQHRYFKKVVL